VNIQKFPSVRNIWLIRLYFVLYYGALGAINPFINLFYVSNKLSGTQIGLLGTFAALVSFLSAPIWGRLNDVARRPRVIMQVTLGLNSLAYYFLSQQTAFLYMAAIIGVNTLISSGINPQSQTQAIIIAEETGAGFGSIRMCGSLGWAITSVLSGMLVQKTGLISAFYAFGILNLLGILVLAFIRTPEQIIRGQALQEKQPRIPLLQVFREVLANRELLAYMFALIAISVLSNGLSFESVYMQQLGASKTAIGWVNSIGAGVEIPMMMLSDRVLRRKGATTTLLLGCVFYILGFLIILIHPSVPGFFFYRVIRGISLSLYTVASTYFVVERAPAQQTGTILALFTVTIVGVVNMVVSPVSGFIFDSAGPYWLYVLSLAGYFIAIVILYFMVVRKKQAASKRVED
jgi:MFS transporter, PPP family, 3-phenylpropionic acid transporter